MSKWTSFYNQKIVKLQSKVKHTSMEGVWFLFLFYFTADEKQKGFNFGWMDIEWMTCTKFFREKLKAQVQVCKCLPF